MKLLSLCFVGLLSLPAPAQVFVKTEDAKLASPDVSPGGALGRTLAVSGDTFAVGARHHHSGVSQGGGVSLFRRTGTQIVQEAFLIAPTPDVAERFGLELDLQGDLLAVRSGRGESQGFNDFASEVLLYERAGSQWSPAGTLRADDPTRDWVFGDAIVIDGDTIAVGDPIYDLPQGNGPGAVFLFRRQGSNWVQEALLRASNEGSNHRFGLALALEGDRLVVGAQGARLAGNPTTSDGQGAAYVFERTGTTWTETQILFAVDGVPGDAFGSDVSLSGDTILIGAAADDEPFDRSGSAFVFTLEDGTWELEQKLVPSDPEDNGNFGAHLALEGDRAAIVGNEHDNASSPTSVSAYVFERSAGTWSEDLHLRSSRGNLPPNGFGDPIAMEGDTIVVGARWGAFEAGLFEQSFSQPGAAFVFDLPRETFSPFCFANLGPFLSGSCGRCPCGNNVSIGVMGGCLNGAGRSCRLTASGLASVSSDTLQFDCIGANSDTFGVLVSGDLRLPSDPVNCPVGTGLAGGLLDGLRCVGGNVRRHGTRPTGADGANLVPWSGPPGVGIAAQGQFVAGQTRYFQLFYRAALDEQCGSGTNTSNGVKVTFGS